MSLTAPTQVFVNKDHEHITLLIRIGNGETTLGFTLKQGETHSLHETQVIRYAWALGDVTIHDPELVENGVDISGSGTLIFGYPAGQVFP